MDSVFTIGFTKKTAEQFFELLKKNNIDVVVDVRLNNISQLAGFSKYPDIEYFLNEICHCEYKPDKLFAPSETTLKQWRDNKISWSQYVSQFDATMRQRNIDEHIKKAYSDLIEKKNICFLCSEETPENCHRRLIAERFASIFGVGIKHLK
jgi:uncharacterized protein (DUF488 family)